MKASAALNIDSSQHYSTCFLCSKASKGIPPILKPLPPSLAPLPSFTSMMASLKSFLKSAKREVSSAAIFFFRSPKHELGCPSASARGPWRKRSNLVMQTLLCSMTPPIDVNNDNAAEYIHSLICDQNRPTLTEEQVSSGPIVELYVLSYRHESGVKTRRISLQRLRTATQVIRSHAAELGRKFYSVWIDSLFTPTFVKPTAPWADRGLPPYALCYVVAIPSESDFNQDLTRAWIRCEQQLAANSRGLLIHPSHEPPSWSEGYHMTAGNAHRKIYGADQMPNCALYALASAICFGMLDGAQVTFQEDLNSLQKWALAVVCARWSAKELYSLPRSSDSAEEVDRKEKARTMLNNSADLYVGWKKDWRLITNELPMIRRQGTRRKWNGAVELLDALSRHIRLSETTDIDEALLTEIRARSKGFLMMCTNGREKGIYVCYWKREGIPLAMELGMISEEDGTKSIVEYRVIHQHSIRMEFGIFLDREEGAEGSDIGKVVCSRKCCEFMNTLTKGLFQDESVVGDQLEVADCSRWFVGMK